MIFLRFKHRLLFILQMIIFKNILLKNIFHLHLIYKVCLFFLEWKVQLFEIVIFLQVSKSRWNIFNLRIRILVIVSIFTFKFCGYQRLLRSIWIFLLLNIQNLIIIVCSIVSQSIIVLFVQRKLIDTLRFIFLLVNLKTFLQIEYELLIIMIRKLMTDGIWLKGLISLRRVKLVQLVLLNNFLLSKHVHVLH